MEHEFERARYGRRHEDWEPERGFGWRWSRGIGRGHDGEQYDDRWERERFEPVERYDPAGYGPRERYRTGPEHHPGPPGRGRNVGRPRIGWHGWVGGEGFAPRGPETPGYGQEDWEERGHRRAYSGDYGRREWVGPAHYGGDFGPDYADRVGTFGAETGARGFAGRGPRGYRRSDERVREEVCDRLTDHPAIDASDVEVSIRDGEITLGGTVPDRRTKRLAEDVAAEVSGVRDVHNHLRVATAVSAEAPPSTTMRARQPGPESARTGAST